MSCFYSMVLKCAMQEKRWSPIHLERAIKFQHGDDLQRWRQRQHEGGMNKEIKNKNMAAYEQESGYELGKQC
ncbi:hypothetical protein PTKIN_Ptkin14bG0125900 [Pterospermum kingtungense]